jgi:hypothetical protein
MISEFVMSLVVATALCKVLEVGHGDYSPDDGPFSVPLDQII